MLPEKPPIIIPFDLITYSWVLGLSLLGGVSSFVRRVRNGETRYSNIVEFIGELVISTFAGLVTFYLCQTANLEGALSAALISVSAHMGTRIIYIFERYLEAYAKRKLGVDSCDIEDVSKDEGTQK